MNASAPKKKILIVLDVGTFAASGMVRGMQYKGLFDRRADLEVEFVSHQIPLLFRAIGRCRKSPALRPLEALLRRVNAAVTLWREAMIVRMARGRDLAYIIKVPALSLYEKLSRVEGLRVVTDLNDGLWLPAHRSDRWRDLEKLLALSHSVVCENAYVAEYAAKFSPRIAVVPDPPQFELFEKARASVNGRHAEKVVLGWVGSVYSSDALFAIFNPLEKLFAKHPNLHLRILGAEPQRLPRFEKVRFSVQTKYTQEDMIREVLAMDVGLFPLFDIEDSYVRGTLKTMIYMSGGAAVIAQDLGENRKLIRNGGNGMLAGTPEEWYRALEEVVTDSARRRAMGAAGVETIRAGFTLEKCAEKLAEAFHAAMA